MHKHISFRDVHRKSQAKVIICTSRVLCTLGVFLSVVHVSDCPFTWGYTQECAPFAYPVDFFDMQMRCYSINKFGDPRLLLRAAIVEHLWNLLGDKQIDL